MSDDTIPLPEEVLARRAVLPRRPASVVLRGRRVELRPLDLDADIDALHAVSCGDACALGGRAVAPYDPDARVWRWMSGGPFDSPSELRGWLAPQVIAPDGLPFTVRELGSGAPVGVVNYLANHPEHLKIELGSLWYGPVAQGTGASAEATYLLLAHAFELGYRRVEWKCDVRNEPSRRAALAYGFTYEGLHQDHYIVKNRSRDTAWFRMLAPEWPAAAARLQARLAAL